MHARKNARSSRKRALDSPGPRNESGLLHSAGDALPPQQSAENIVAEAKVKEYLARHTATEKDAESDEKFLVKTVVCDTEAAALDLATLDALKSAFLVNVSISGKQGLSIDRIVTVDGQLTSCIRCALYIAFLLASKVNNVLKRDAFTLKLANYNVDLLVEASGTQLDRTLVQLKDVDSAPFQNNADLHVATLRGDFTSLFQTICKLVHRHPLTMYTTDEAIELLPSVRIHDADFMYPRTTEDQREKLSQFLRNQAT